MEERVQKILARAGYGSRRASEELITAGRVRINGVVAVLGSKADPHHDKITVDNQPIAQEQGPIYIALHKPQGILSEVSPDEPRQTVRDMIPLPGHMFIVGRLDLDSEGLILLTNDGELANHLTHPRYGHEKEYAVLVGVRPDDQQMEAWRHGVVLEDGVRTAPAKVRLASIAGKGAWLNVILNEGRKRQIREMGKQTGMPVLRIIRVRIGTLLLGDLRPGQWRHLRPEEIRALRGSKGARETQRPRTRSAGPTRTRTERRAPGERPARTARSERSPRSERGPRPGGPTGRPPRRERPAEAQQEDTGGIPRRAPARRSEDGAPRSTTRKPRSPRSTPGGPRRSSGGARPTTRRVTRKPS